MGTSAWHALRAQVQGLPSLRELFAADPERGSRLSAEAAGLLLGVMSHLILDEIYAVEWKGGRWRFKKSFGTAMKLWGKNAWANISTYGKLIIVVLMILGEPMVMDR